VRATTVQASPAAPAVPGRASLTGLGLLDAILPHCEPAEACLKNEEGRFAWLHTGPQVTSAIEARRDGRRRPM
jgi:hypothetical protein